VEALWLGGDNVVESGIEQLINAANKAQIPLFTNNPYNIRGNTLFGIGAEYLMSAVLPETWLLIY